MGRRDMAQPQSRRWLMRLVVAAALLLLAVPGPARGQERASQLAVPEWASVDGWGTFVRNGCAKCHSLRGVGGSRGPDLAALPAQTGFFEMAAAVWNHVPRMGAEMWATGVERQVTPQELSALLAFIFTARYLDVSGDPIAGERLFATRRCADCHAPGDKGDRRGPALDGLEKNSPIFLSAAMWNHGTMTAARPPLDTGDLQHIVAYLVRSARATDAARPSILADTPKRGHLVFANKGCAGCHTRESSRRRDGPPVSLSNFAERMWNHNTAIKPPGQRAAPAAQRLTGQDVAVLVGHFFAARYFDTERGDGPRGQALVADKGCLSCHAVYGRGGKRAPDLATSNVVSSVDGQLAAMWNHGRLMRTTARRLPVPLQELTGRELADIATYLAGVGKSSARPR